MATKSYILILIGFLCLTSACSAKRSAQTDPRISSNNDFAAMLGGKAELVCDGAEIFATSTAFNCDREACFQSAHDRTEETCPDSCRDYHVCTPPLVCSGTATFCQEPLVLEFKTPNCPNGIVYHCVGSCRCSCSCVQEG